MERLTQWFGSSRLGREAGMAPKYDRVYTEEELINVLLSHLAAYEDTGLDPDGIQALKVMLGRREGELLTDFDGIPLARMLEIAQAEKAGRLVVLPCKVGDRLYVPTRGIISCFESTHIEVREDDDSFWFWIGWRLKHGILGGKRIDGVYASEIGKTVFLTRQAAEEALREEDENG